jgi:excisionase family DNA binding protein
MASPQSYSTIEVARRLGVSLQTVQRWVDAGRLTAWKTLGGHRRIEAASAERLFAEHESRLGPAEPAPAAAPSAPVEAEAQAGAAAVRSALIVEDNELDRELLVQMLGRVRHGVRIETVADGFEALIAIGRSDPDILITDVHLPHMDGIEMLRRLSTETRPRQIVAVSAFTADELPALRELPPGVRFLRKPIDVQRLAEVLGDMDAATGTPA